MRKIILLLCLVCSLYHAQSQICNTPYHIVVIGSSTAEGMGATPNHGWVALYTQYLKGINTGYQVDNLAVGGYTTYDLCPTGFIPPASRPSPDAEHNITKALSLHPDAIIINLPTNDVARNYTLTEQQDNFNRMVNLATAQGVKVWVTTSQPRNDFNASQVAALKDMRDWTFSYYGDRSIDFWTGTTEANDSIKRIYSYGDGIHMNDAGHQLLYTRVVARNIPGALCDTGSPAVVLSNFAVTNVTNKLQLNWNTASEDSLSLFVLQRSTDSTNWTLLTQVTPLGNDTTGHAYTFLDTTAYIISQYYRLDMVTTTSQHIYSRVVKGIPDTAYYTNPFNLTSFAVEKSQDKLNLLWYTNGEKTTARFEIEHSTDSLNWNTIGTVAAAGNYTASRFYTFKDTAIYQSAQYYRLNMVTTNNRHFFSSVVKGIPDTLYANPFRLSVFTVALQTDRFLLNWSTTAEKNTNRFTVERSADSLAWTGIGNVNAAGNATNIRSYSFTDTATRTTAAWYRLNMLTHDNRIFYSPVIKSLPATLPPDTVPAANTFNLTTFSVDRFHDQLHLNWKTNNESNTSVFIIERSADSLSWANIANVAAAGNYTGQRSYNYPDTTIHTSAQYYRLHMVTQSNGHFYSNVLKGMPDTMYARPFRLSSFTLTQLQGKFRLNWSTSAEGNTWQFLIERSTDSLSWNSIGTVNAAGNASSTRSYLFTDTATLSGDVYYRLNMVTYDNRHFYSNGLKGAISLLLSSGLQYVAYIPPRDYITGADHPLSLLAVPNPAQGNVKIAGLTAGTHQVKVYDLSGRLIYLNRQFQPGTNIATAAWATGLYIIIVDDSKQQVKLIRE